MTNFKLVQTVNVVSNATFCWYIIEGAAWLEGSSNGLSHDGPRCSVGRSRFHSCRVLVMSGTVSYQNCSRTRINATLQSLRGTSSPLNELEHGLLCVHDVSQSIYS